MKNRGVLLCALSCAAFACAEACGGTNDALFSGKHRNADAGPGLDASSSSNARGAGGKPGTTACKNSLDCVGATDDRLVCDRAAGTCVECVADADCDANTRCYDNHCRASCTSDKDCTVKGLLCDSTAGHCVECLVDGDCGAHQVCAAGSCEAMQRPGAGGGPPGAGGTSDGGRTGGAGRPSGGRTGGAGASTGGVTADGGDRGSGGAIASGGASSTGGRASGGVAGSGGVTSGGATGSGGVTAGGTTGAGGGGMPSCTGSILGVPLSCSAACPCGLGAGCLHPSDCGSGVCTLGTGGSSGTCTAAPTCSNGVRDGLETGVDCGGLGCTKCAAGKGCEKNTDCLSANCTSSVCVACDPTTCPKPAIYGACCRSTGACGMSIGGTLCI
jgi:hypothetical protein